MLKGHEYGTSVCVVGEVLPEKTLVLLGIDQIAQVLFHAYPSQGDLESEVEELGERSLEASKLVEPRENSYIEFRVCSLFYVEDSE